MDLSLPDYATLKDFVLFALAIYGAGLSSWNLWQALRRDRRKVRVTASSIIPAASDGSMGDTFVALNATNVGQRPVTIALLAFELPGGKKRLFDMWGGDQISGYPDTELPATLTDGQSARKLFSYRSIGQALLSDGHSGTVSLTPVSEDTAGGVHRGDPWQVNPQEWMKM